jgi:acetolactate synthase I/II/III large subunit
MKVSDYIFSFLKSNSIDMVFLVSGGASAHLLDSLKKTNIRYICNYHEQSCAMAAEGYTKISNKPACVLVTNGPGSSNAITGVLGAYQDSIPMIILSGQVPVDFTMRSNNSSIRQLGVQECDIINIVKPITKYAVQLQNVEDIDFHLKMAYQMAMTGRRGPVWIDIPLDIQSSDIPDRLCMDDVSPPINEPMEISYNINEIIELIFSSKKPLIITGNGIHLSGSEHLFNELKEILKIPIISTWTSKDLMNHSDSLFIGNFGI